MQTGPQRAIEGGDAQPKHLEDTFTQRTNIGFVGSNNSTSKTKEHPFDSRSEDKSLGFKRVAPKLDENVLDRMPDEPGVYLLPKTLNAEEIAFLEEQGLKQKRKEAQIAKQLKEFQDEVEQQVRKREEISEEQVPLAADQHQIKAHDILDQVVVVKEDKKRKRKSKESKGSTKKRKTSLVEYSSD